MEKIYKELYEHNIQELDEEQADVIRKVLSLLLVAKVPLRTSELCQLVCAPEESDMSIETVLDMCFDLVRLDTIQDHFRFSHLSVREFLEKRENEFGQASMHGMATRACLASLSSSKTITPEDYAVLYWAPHAEDTVIRQSSTSSTHFLRHETATTTGEMTDYIEYPCIVKAFNSLLALR